MTSGTKDYDFPKTFRDAMALPECDFKSIFGQQAVKGWRDIRQIEAFFRCLTEPVHVIELGCGAGWHSLYIAMSLGFRDHENRYDAYDVSEEAWRVSEFSKRIGARITFHCSHDVFKQPVDALGDGSGKKVLYCDIGPEDIVKFAPALRSWDYIIVHDWKQKNYKAAVQKLIEGGVVAYFEQETWERTGEHMGFVRL